MNESKYSRRRLDFIGTKFGNIEVVSCDGTKVGNDLIFTVKCIICEKDNELFGHGLFKATKYQLQNGKLSCGCSSAYRWTSEQYITRIKRECRKRKYQLVYAVGVLNSKSMITLKCENGHDFMSTIANFLRGRKCSKCKIQWRKLDGVMIDSFLRSGKFRKDTTFWRATNRYWNYTCPKCSIDEYVKAGLCSGIFTGACDKLQAGQISCRCSRRYNWTNEQRAFQISKIIERDCLPYIFICITGTGALAAVTINCDKHGNFIQRIHSFVNGGTRCPECAEYGFNQSLPAVFYVIDAGNFTGYGISNDIRNRLSVHKKNLLNANLELKNLFCFYMSGKEALELERLVKNTFPVVSQDIDGFINEATHHHLLKDVINFAEEYTMGVNVTK